MPVKNNSEIPKESQATSPKKTPDEQAGSFLSPEALVMFLAAIILDMIGLVIFILDFVFGIGLALSFIPDVLGLIFIGGWMLLRTGHTTISKRAQRTVKKTGKKILKRLGLSFLGEILPFFGDIAPCWTLAVYFELKNN